MIYIRELQELVEPMIAEPSSDEAKEVIHNDNTHVSEVWEDGEITSTKSGDLYRQRSLHQSKKPMLPEGQVLFSYEMVDDDEKWRELRNRKSHKRMVIVDDELRDVLDKWRHFPVSEEMVEWFWDHDCPKCGEQDWDYERMSCKACGNRTTAMKIIQE